jgi:LuxR family maltose regulon positive regulatory protein
MDRYYTDAMATFQKAGYLSDVVGCAMGLADVRIEQGRLDDAMRLYERILELATGDGAALRGAADMHVGISTILRERNDLVGARTHLQLSHDLGEESGLPQNPYRSLVALARIRQAEGDLTGALEALADAERLYVSDFFPDVRPIAARTARLWTDQGALAKAWGWAQERGLAYDNEVTYLLEFDHVTLARLLLAQGRRDGAADRFGEALDLLERLRASAEGGGRVERVIEILVVQALAQDANGQASRALDLLEEAVSLAEPEGFVRVFADEGPPMAKLLSVAAKRRIAPHLVPRLLAAFGRGGERSAHVLPMAEPLSERELEVLRLLQGDLGGPDIARELVVSLNTVRTHTKNIYAKLGVNSRRAAVRRAADLGLLSRSGDHGRTT